VTGDIDSWYPPSEDDYVFTVSGSIAADGDEAALEQGVQEAIASLLKDDGSLGPEAMQGARASVARALLFDVQTTEDAAHQLATFAGMGALDVLTGLPRAVAQVAPGDVRRVASAWLGPEQRTIGWFVPENAGGAASHAVAAPADEAPPQRAEVATGAVAPLLPVAAGAGGPEPAGAPVVRALPNGSMAIVQRSPLSPTVHLKLVLGGTVELTGSDAESAHNQPAWGVTSLDLELLPNELEPALAELARQLARAAPAAAAGADASDTNDPGERLELLFRDVLGLRLASSGPGEAGSAVPLLAVVTGDVEPDTALRILSEAFAGMAPPPAQPRAASLNPSARMEVESALTRPVAQERLGYVVAAPGPTEPAAAAWQMALYLLSHGYEGRLGKKAISERGLVYYIDSEYGSDGRNGWVTLNIGVDPDKLPAVRELMRAELERLVSEPPTQADLDEARRHLLGRQLSAAQSNRELADRLSREWLWYGEVPRYEDLRQRLERVTLQELLDVLQAFTAGTIVAVRNPGPA
jgi:predicted Zn-dependent peptidase